MTRRDALTVAGAGALMFGASIGLAPVLEGTSWRAAVWPAIAAALTAAAVGRAVRAGAVATLVGSGAVWIAVTYVVHLPTSGLLPGLAQAQAFAALWQEGMTTLIAQPAPIDPSPGVLLLLATVAWWMTHGVHEILVRARKPGLAILTAGALWGVAVAVPQPGNRTWPYVLPILVAAAYVLLVDPDPRIERSATASYLPSSGIALGAFAIIVGTAMPGLLPGYGSDGWIDLRAASAARGYQPIVDVTQRLKLPAPRDLLLVETERPVYLRLAGLDTFDGGTWKLGPSGDRTYTPRNVMPANRTLPLEAEIRERRTLEVHIENLGLENVFVPAPYHPVEVSGTAASRMVFSPEGSFIATSEVTEGEPALIPGLDYSVTSAVPTPTADGLTAIPWSALDDPAFTRWTELPRDFPAIRQLAEEIVAAVDTPFAAALAIQEHFRSSGLFEYSTDVAPLRTPEALDRFVTSPEPSDRIGYCEYFATGMAVMLRMAGIPARVAVGFRLGYEVAPDSWIVTSDHAHAWVEALFPGYGWIQFEPTPALPDTLVPTASDPVPTSPVGAEPGAGETGDPEQPEDPEVPVGPAPPVDPPASGSEPEGQGLGIVPRILIALLALAGAAVGVSGGASIASARRARPRPDLPTPDRVIAAQRRIFTEARGYGVPRHESETTRDVALRWSDEGRVASAAALRFAAIAQSAAFGGQVGDAAGPAAERLAETIVADLRASVPTTARTLAPLRATAYEIVVYGRRALRR